MRAINTEMLRVLHNNMVMAKLMNGASGVKIGDTIMVHKPARYLA